MGIYGLAWKEGTPVVTEQSKMLLEQLGLPSVAISRASSKDYDVNAWVQGSEGNRVTPNEWVRLMEDPNNAHFNDRGKLPNHPTFSTESAYYNPNDVSRIGGTWSGNEKDGWVFNASQHNVDVHGEQGLANYFKRNEPESKLVLPK